MFHEFWCVLRENNKKPWTLIYLNKYNPPFFKDNMDL